MYIGMSSLARGFAIDFANAVTTHSPNQYDWVARRGTYSIYNMIHNLDSMVKEQIYFDYSDV